MLNNLIISSEGSGFTKITSRKITLTANSPGIILEANDARAYVIIVNLTPSIVNLILGDANATSINSGIPLVSKGSSYEITSLNLYKGRISAITSMTSDIIITEGSY